MKPSGRLWNPQVIILFIYFYFAAHFTENVYIIVAELLGKYNTIVEENSSLKDALQYLQVQESVGEECISRIRQLEAHNQSLQDERDLVENTACNLRAIIQENEVSFVRFNYYSYRPKATSLSPSITTGYHSKAERNHLDSRWQHREVAREMRRLSHREKRPEPEARLRAARDAVTSAQV